MTKQAFYHPDVDYSHLNDKEKQIKSYRDLYTIFYLTRNCGLTDLEIHDWTQKLKLPGYDNAAPDSVIRGAIYRWNDFVVGSVTNKKRCENVDCLKICSWGYEKNNPMRCAKHVLTGMKKVVEERVIKKKREGNASKGKFYLDESFASKVFPGSVPSLSSSSSFVSHPVAKKAVKSSVRAQESGNFMNPRDMMLKPGASAISTSSILGNETIPRQILEQDLDDPEFETIHEEDASYMNDYGEDINGMNINQNYLSNLSSEILSGEYSISNGYPMTGRYGYGGVPPPGPADQRGTFTNQNFPGPFYPMGFPFHPAAMMQQMHWNPMFRVPPWYPMYPSLYALDLCYPQDFYQRPVPPSMSGFGNPRASYATPRNSESFGGQRPNPRVERLRPVLQPQLSRSLDYPNPAMRRPRGQIRHQYSKSDGLSLDSMRLENLSPNSYVEDMRTIPAVSNQDQDQAMPIFEHNPNGNPHDVQWTARQQHECENSNSEMSDDTYFQDLLKDLGDPVKNLQIPNLGNPVFGDELNFDELFGSS